MGSPLHNHYMASWAENVGFISHFREIHRDYLKREEIVHASRQLYFAVTTLTAKLDWHRDRLLLGV